jgi:drug/metabolite transporter (DMT)-like permease
MKPLFKIQLALICTVFFWASAFIGIRVGLTEYSPGSLALLRFLVASLCMGFLYFRVSNESPIPLRDKLELGLIGVVGIGVYHVCLNYGEISVSAGIASFIIGLMPAFSILLSLFFFKERPNSGVWLGILISFLGLYLIMSAESQVSDITLGIPLVLIAAFMGAFQNVIQKRYIHHHPITVTAWILWGGTLSMIGFFPTLCSELPQTSLSTSLAVVYLGVFPAALAYLTWSYVLEHMSITQASLYLYAMPVMSTLIAYVYLNESPSLLSLLGGVVALLGAVIAQRFNQARKVEPLT